jgi:hypothetical protein
MSEPLERRREHNRALTIAAVVDIHRLAPDEQLDELRDSLSDLSEDLEQLSCSG